MSRVAPVETAPWLLKIDDLHVEFQTYGGIVKAVRGVSLGVARGKTLAIVGESGCGKSVTVQSIMGLIPMPPGRITNGTAMFEGADIIRRKVIRGAKIGMIFQDPMSSLNPTMTIGAQIAETLVVHRGLGASQAWQRAVELLHRVHIPEAEDRARQYPFTFSGGMLQRAMIAMAIACEPSLLIADEPTTALDVTIQSQILDLLRELQQTTGMAIILITHNLGVVARLADYVAVMYAGRIVERGTTDDIFYRAAHPYTVGLRAAMPANDPERKHGLKPIEGTPPDMFAPPKGCSYFARCPHAMQICENNDPPTFEVAGPGELNGGHGSDCWLQHESAPMNVNDVFRGRTR
jgi:oligopeptide/dipeptide ABC transporter ATP-binding protein